MNTPPDNDTTPASQRRASFAQTVKAVAWSFLGIRQRAAYEQDVQQLNPVHVIIAGVVGAVLFIITLVMIVRWVVGSA